jgi:hypothetical protein
MALTDKDILITPNKGQTAEPKIEFKGASSTLGAQTISLNVYPTDNGTVSFEGSAGQLFSITNSLSGTIYSVNDVSGIPSIEVLDTGLIKLGQYNGNILLGTATDNGLDKLQVNGSIALSNKTRMSAVTYTTTTTSQVAIDTFASATYRTAKYVVQLSSGSNYQSSELLVVHNGTTAYVSQFGVVNTNTDLGAFDVSLASGTVSLLLTPVNASTTVVMHRILINV